MILHPLNCLSSLEYISEIIVLAQDPEEIKQGLLNHPISNKVKFCKSNGSIATTVMNCIQQLNLSLPLMITTADNCLLTAADVDDFLTQTVNSPADLAIGFARQEVVIAAYPETRRTWIPFKDVKVTGCNLFLLTSNKSMELIRFWNNFESSPKKFLKLAWALGPAFFYRFLFRQLSIAETFARISDLTGIKVMPAFLKHPEVSIDADKFTDILQIESILEQNTRTVKHNPIKQQPGSPVVIFDLDRTITRNGTFMPFLIYYACRQNPLRLLFLPVIIVLMLGYTLKLLDRKQLKSLMYGLIIGNPDKADLDRICTAFVDRTLDKHVYPEALYTIREWQNKNAHLILATASYDWMANVFAQRLKFDSVIATKSITIDGKIIPGVDGDNCYGQAKLRMVTEALDLIATAGVKKQDIWFYTDHHTDIPLLKVCNHPVAVNASRRLMNWIKSRPDGLLLDWHSRPVQIASKGLLTAINNII